MGKLVKLNESDLIKIVKNIINEQVTFSEIKGTTSKEPINSVKVLTNAGLKADVSNFKGRWVLEGVDIGPTFSRIKNLSLFKNQTPTSPKGGENFIEFTVRRFTKVELNPDKTVKTKSVLDESTPAKVESLTGSGTKSFNTSYIDETDKKYIWKMTKIVASGNGLLALSRALVESKLSYPNKITIGFSQETRTSTSYEFNATVVGNLTSFLNGLNLMVTAYILKVNGIPFKDVQGDDYISSFVKKFSTMSQEEIADYITRSFYSMDKFFIPENEIETFRNKKTTDGQPVLPNYNSEPILNLLKTIPKNDTLINSIYRRNETNVKKDADSYNIYNNLFSPEIVKQYKNRLLSFFTFVYGLDQAKQLINNTTFKGASRDISSGIHDAIFGVKRAATSDTISPEASERKSSSLYNIGSSIPGQEPG